MGSDILVGIERLIYHCNWQIDLKGLGGGRGESGVVTFACCEEYRDPMQQTITMGPVNNLCTKQSFKLETWCRIIWIIRIIMMPEDVLKRSKCIVTLYTHMILWVSNDSWNYATMVLPVITFNWILSSCWQDQAVLLLVKFWW